MDYVDVSFISKINGSKTSIRLYSHYTCIYGAESGEGKSYFISIIEDGLSTDTLYVEISDSSLQFAIADAMSLPLAFTNSSRYVILIDESSMLKDNIVQQVNKSKHLFICVSRSMPFRMDYPLKGMYTLVRTVIDGIEDIDIKSVEALPVETNFSTEKDVILTEAKEGRSENELLSIYLQNVKGAEGRDRLEKCLRGTKDSVLVFADLGNIGLAYALLLKRCKQNPNIKFYDYLCFEQLLYESNLVQVLGNKPEIGSVFDSFSIESWYEGLLEEFTKHTILEYKHGKPLSKDFLNKRNFGKIFSSEVGRGIKEYIKHFGILK